LLVFAFHGLVFERLRIQNGMLGLVIVVAGLLGAFAPLFTNTLQGLKKFRELSLVNIIAAPIRLIVILIMMPIRPLTGFFVAHGSVPFAQIVASTVAIKNTIFSREVKQEPYLDVKTRRWFIRFLFLNALFVVPMIVGNCVETMVIRQRLSAIDSAAYYMLSRIAEIGGYLGLTLMVVIFPFASEQHEKKKDSDLLLLRVICASAIFSLLFAIICYFSKNFVLPILPNGELYLGYTKEYMILIFIFSALAIWYCFVNNEMAAESFSFLRYDIPLQLIFIATLFIFTGYGYFDGYLPNAWVDFLRDINACRLDFLLIMIASLNALRLIFIAIHIFMRRKCVACAKF
jgi:O-antigen/teichoic acid export membrane protein